MSILIVGCAGFVGRNLKRSLEQWGMTVRGISSTDGTGLDPQSGLLPNDFAMPAGTKVVVYLSQSPWYARGSQMAHHVINVNLLSPVRLAELSRLSGVRRFIYASTGNVYAPSFLPLPENAPLRRDNWYSLTKVHGEEALSLFKSDMEVIIARPFGIYGPDQTGRLVPNIMRSIRAGEKIRIQRNPVDSTDVDGLKISLCHVDDALEIYRLLIVNGGPSYLNVAGERPVSIREIATVLSRSLGMSVEFQITDQTRDTDLIADTIQLARYSNFRFKSLEVGLRESVEYIRAFSERNA